MDFVVKRSKVGGEIRIPGSKSHAIRAMLFGALAGGASVLHNPLDSSDTRSCLAFIRALGAEVDTSGRHAWVIEGFDGRPRPQLAAIDVGNSGTTLFLGMAVAAASSTEVEITGDDQTKRRDAGPLLRALCGLGATAYSKRGNGCAPLVVGGGIRGGDISIECPTSQYLSGLLAACPLADKRSTINVPLLYEKPYVEMTLDWLARVGIELDHDDNYGFFSIPGGQSYRNFEIDLPADFSSATFFLLAAAVCGGPLILKGLDMSDAQGDKEAVWMFERMGCGIEIKENTMTITGPDRLKGGDFDLNATPDALPALAVAGALAEGQTRLLNVPQARIKETDRISVMARELGKMGADITELKDGLVINGKPGQLKSARLHGHSDHRVVMALAVAGLVAEGRTIVDTAESVDITCPQFQDLMSGAGADIVKNNV